MVDEFGWLLGNVAHDWLKAVKITRKLGAHEGIDDLRVNEMGRN